jgi:phospholipid/cholesterol/gamma-HCH transport system substrate-binding protein
MNKKQHTELLVGIFLLAGIVAITFLALKMGDLDLFDNNQYMIKTRFTSASGLKEGAYVEIAGVQYTGRLNCINKDIRNYWR